MFAAMLVANIVNLVFAKEIMIRACFTEMRMTLLLPVIGVLCVIGSYAVNNSMFDVLMMALFGIVGFLMHGTYSRTPMVIALLLGPMLEPALRQVLLMGGLPARDAAYRAPVPGPYSSPGLHGQETRGIPHHCQVLSRSDDDPDQWA